MMKLNNKDVVLVPDEIIVDGRNPIKEKSNDENIKILISVMRKVSQEEKDNKNLRNVLFDFNQENFEEPFEEEEFENIFNEQLLKHKVPDYIYKGKVDTYALALLITKDKNFLVDDISMYVFNGKYYADLKQGIFTSLMNYLRDTKLMKTATAREIDEVIKRLCYTTEIKQCRTHIPCKNGLLNVETRELEDFTPDAHITGINNFEYDPNNADITGTEFEKYLVGCLGEDYVQVVQEMIGVSLFPVTHRTHYFYSLIGDGRNGKSVLMNLIAKIIPDVLRAGIPLKGYDTKFTNAEIKGKALNICFDDTTTVLEEIGNLKAVSSGEGIFVEKKGKTGMMIQTYITSIHSFNALPTVREKASAFFARNIVIPFEHSYGSAEEVARGEKEFIADKELANKLELEIDIIANWAIKGLFKLIDNRYKFKETSYMISEKKSYQEQCDSVLSFVNNTLEKKMLHETKNENLVKQSCLLELYRSYCEINEIPMPLKKMNFYKRLKQILKMQHKKHNNVDYYAVSIIGEIKPAF